MDPSGAPAGRAGGGPLARRLVAAATAGFVELVTPPHELPPPRYTGRLRWRVPVVAAVLTVSIGFITTEDFARSLPAFPLALVASTLYVLPLALLFYWPLIAWRLSYVVAAVGPWLLVVESPGPVDRWGATQVLLLLLVSAVVAGRYRLRVVLWTWLFTVAVAALHAGSGGRVGAVLLFSAVMAIGFVVGRWRHARNQLTAEEERAELERAKRTVAEERTRIAREMHDVVAHHMSMVAVQAETAPYRLGELPEPARTEFVAIASSARDALTEMRQLLGVLRRESQAADLAPQPGIAQVAELVAAARRAGAVVELHSEGDNSDVPAAVGVTAYRIVQESLSNAVRHAPGAPVRVELRYQPHTVTVTVANDPPPATARTSTVDSQVGHGIAGMRERVAMLSGSLLSGSLLPGSFRAGPTPGGGYEVRALLPRAPGQGSPE